MRMHAYIYRHIRSHPLANKDIEAFTLLIIVHISFNSFPFYSDAEKDVILGFLSTKNACWNKSIWWMAEFAIFKVVFNHCKNWINLQSKISALEKCFRNSVFSLLKSKQHYHLWMKTSATLHEQQFNSKKSRWDKQTIREIKELTETNKYAAHCGFYVYFW